MCLRLFVLWCCVPLFCWGQKQSEPTRFFEVSGAVKTTITVKLDDLSAYQEHSIEDIVITNHLGEPRSTATGLKGVLLKDVLSKVEPAAKSPREFSQFALVCVANDGYTVVYSWNELFNSPVGDQVYLITEQRGERLEAMNDSILMLSASDFRTGRRFLKALTRIDFQRLD